MTIKDRGNKKWVSLMLVEHRRGLERLKQKEAQRSRPELDSQQLREMNYLLEQAYRTKEGVKLTYYREYDRQFVELTGQIDRIDSNNYRLKLVPVDGEDFWVKASRVMKLELLGRPPVNHQG